MKKVAIFCLALVITISACGSPAAQSSSTPEDVSVSSVPISSTDALMSSEAIASSSTSSGVGVGGIEVEKKLLTVDITLPALLFSDEGFGLTETEIEEYKSENGFSKVVKHDDGSVTITMSKAKHKELLSEMEDTFSKNYSELIGAEFTPYIKAIEHKENARTVIVDVVRADYENAVLEMTPWVIGMNGSVFQYFSGLEPRVKIIIRDEADKSEIESFVFPNDFTD